MNLGTSLHWISKKMSDKIAIIENGNEVSYSDLWSNIELLAKAFLKKGIRQDDRIVLVLPNGKEFIYSFYALSRINAISVPLNPSLTPYELIDIFDDCSPKAVITTLGIYKKSISHIDNANRMIILVNGSGDADQNKCQFQFEELLEIAKSENEKLPNINTNNNHVATINYTYRGLGKPLGAMLTHGNYHHGAIGYVRLTEVATSQRVILITPISHIFTLVSCVIVPLLRGATVVIIKSFIPRHVFKIIQEYKIDFMIAVPTIYISLLRNYKKNPFDISSLKYGITGGSYLSLNVQREIKNVMGIELLQGYGLTETMPIACNPRSKNKPESLGVPGHEVKVKIVDGEIVIGGPTVMREYYNKNGENRKFFKNGWFYTGDAGWIDKEGYIYFKGLRKDIVKVGGHNVDLKEVKNVLSSFRGVTDVQLKAVEDDLWGHVINAEIEIASKKEITEKAIRSFCKKRLAIYKIPKNIFITKGKA
ncbi:MAG: class I adenylate-forming enzyme family protein [Candidatus Omnitrophota bacterium]